MKVYSFHHPEICIENPMFVSVRWGDDTPSYHVIEPDLVREYGMAWGEQGAEAEIISMDEARAMIARGVWFGIKEATASGCSAWGSIRIQE